MIPLLLLMLLMMVSVRGWPTKREAAETADTCVDERTGEGLREAKVKGADVAEDRHDGGRLRAQTRS